jgi:hypothetical protein
VSTEAEKNFQAAPGEDTEYIMCALLQRTLKCRSVKLMQLPIYTSYMCSIYSIIIPNPVCSH